MFGYIILAVVVIAVFTLITIYNRLVALRQARQNAFADIDVQLKQRCDLLPNLVETVKGYAGHEKSVLENITASRARAMSAGNNVAERASAEAAVSGALMNLLAVSENYPDLKANQNFMSLQGQLTDLEYKISAARRFFNNATSEYNASIQSFPAVLFAGAFNFKNEEEFLEFSSEEKTAMAQPPKVNFGS